MEQAEFIKLNVVLQPPADVSAEAARLSQHIARDHPSEVVLDGREFHPHVTLYSGEYPVHSTQQIFAVAGQVAQAVGPLACVFSRLSAEPDGGILVELQATGELRHVHDLALSKLSPLREGHVRARYDERSVFYQSLSELERQYARRYGYHHVLNLWRPHITLAKLETESRAQEVMRTLRWPIGSFTVSSLAVYTTGPYGTCRDLLASYKLVGS